MYAKHCAALRRLNSVPSNGRYYAPAAGQTLDISGNYFGNLHLSAVGLLTALPPAKTDCIFVSVKIFREIEAEHLV